MCFVKRERTLIVAKEEMLGQNGHKIAFIVSPKVSAVLPVIQVTYRRDLDKK